MKPKIKQRLDAFRKHINSEQFPQQLTEGVARASASVAGVSAGYFGAVSLRDVAASKLNQSGSKHYAAESALSGKEALERTREFMKDSFPGRLGFADAPKERPQMTTYLPKHHVVVTPKGVSPSILAHEMGHAAQGSTSMRRKMMQGIKHLNGFSTAIPALGAIQYARYHKSDPEKAKKWAKGTFLAGAVSSMPILALEADASRRSLKMLRAARGAGTGYTQASYRSARKGLARSFGSYVAQESVGPAILGGTILGLKGYDHFSKKRAERAMLKKAGGPGSGVGIDNTETISGYERSPLVSLHTRQAIMDKRRPEREGVQVPLSKVRYVGQSKYVVTKLGRMLDALKRGRGKGARANPVKLLFDGDDYHVMDGHHRFLAAKRAGHTHITADVWRAKKKVSDQMPGTPGERLARAEHDQWRVWASSLLKTLNQKGETALATRIRGWTPLFVPYSELSEADKDKDRIWARRAERALAAPITSSPS